MISLVLALCKTINKMTRFIELNPLSMGGWQETS